MFVGHCALLRGAHDTTKQISLLNIRDLAARGSVMGLENLVAEHVKHQGVSRCAVNKAVIRQVGETTTCGRCEVCGEVIDLKQQTLPLLLACL